MGGSRSTSKLPMEFLGNILLPFIKKSALLRSVAPGQHGLDELTRHNIYQSFQILCRIGISMLVRSNCMKCLIEFAGYVIVTNNNNNNKNKLNWESEQVRPPRGRFNDRLIMLSERFE